MFMPRVVALFVCPAKNGAHRIEDWLLMRCRARRVAAPKSHSLGGKEKVRKEAHGVLMKPHKYGRNKK